MCLHTLITILKLVSNRIHPVTFDLNDYGLPIYLPRSRWHENTSVYNAVYRERPSLTVKMKYHWSVIRGREHGLGPKQYTVNKIIYYCDCTSEDARSIRSEYREISVETTAARLYAYVTGTRDDRVQSHETISKPRRAFGPGE